jgi:predicted RNA methylase
MSGFSTDWLTLREPYDLRSRNAMVLDAVAAHLEPDFSVQIVDLACGTGSTSRALGPLLPVRQNWRMIDNDLGLLARARAAPVAGDTASTSSRSISTAISKPHSTGRSIWWRPPPCSICNHGWTGSWSRPSRARSRFTPR